MRYRHRRGAAAPRRVRETALVAVLGTALSGTGAVIAWRADLAGSRAATFDRQGIVEAVRYQGEAARAETDAYTEQRTFTAYALARTRQQASAALSPVEAVTQQRLADRLERGFAASFVRWGAPNHYAGASFDTGRRAAELLRERDVHDGSAALFERAREEKDRRQSLLAVAVVLALGLAATAVGQVSADRRYTVGGVVGGCLSLGYAVAALVTAA